jgi:restriction endonuclease S subunit
MKNKQTCFLLLIFFLLSGCNTVEDFKVLHQVSGPIGTNCYLIYGTKLKEAALIDPGWQYKEFQIKINDLLIAMTGATIGKVGIYNHPDNSLLNQRNGIIKPDNINSIYLMSLLNLPIFQKLILRNSNGGAQPNISETDIMRISIPVPPLDKQKEIAEHITDIRQQAQQLKDKTKEALKKASEEIEKILIG